MHEKAIEYLMKRVEAWEEPFKGLPTYKKVGTANFAIANALKEVIVALEKENETDN